MPDYTRLAGWYDEIFPVSAMEMAFVNSRLGPANRILDIGCGTGNKTVLLAPGRENVNAVDADPGMIAAARASHSRPNIDYAVLDMNRIADRFPARSFDAAVCLGNTMAHLPGPDGLASFLDNLRNVLVPGGRFLAQILNYDRILDNNVSELPRIETDNVVFTRWYEWRDDAFHFVSECRSKTDGATDHGDTVLYPFRKGEVESLLAEHGFSRPGSFGSYDGAEWTPSSYHLIFDTTTRSTAG